MPTINTVTDESSAISWGAITAGAACSLAATLILVTFGVGAGLSIVSPWSGEGVSSAAAARTAGLMLVAVAMISSTVGGFVAGRLRPSWLGVHEDERYFRDTAHGLTAWAVATLISVAVLGGATTKIVGSAASGVTGAATIAASQSNAGGYVERLLRTNPSQPVASSGQNNAGQNNNDAALRTDITRLFAAALSPRGQLAPEDRTYLASVVASRAGISQTEAEQRIDQAITQAKQAADTARRTGAKLSFWIAASLLAGALAAMLAATVGGWLRSSTWWEPARPVVVANNRKR